MNDKTIWFGRYLGCKCVIPELEDIHPTLTGVNYDAMGDLAYFNKLGPYEVEFISDCVLILKELEDISDDDAKICIKKHWLLAENIEILKINKYVLNYSYTHNLLGRVKTDQISFVAPELKVRCIDFLRSKGYAIGIPKEFYITESELKETE